MKKMIIAAMSVILAISLTGCFSNYVQNSSTIVSDIPESSQESQQEQVSSADSSSEESKEESTVAKVGQSVEGPDWKISLLSAKTYEKVGDEYFEQTPADGKVYLICFFEVENVSDEDNYFNYFNIESYVDGYNESMSILMSDVEDVSILTGDVAAGKKLKGYLAWEVDPEWKELEISYKSNLWTGEKAATFVVTPDQVTTE